MVKRFQNVIHPLIRSPIINIALTIRRNRRLVGMTGPLRSDHERPGPGVQANRCIPIPMEITAESDPYRVMRLAIFSGTEIR